MSSHDSLIEQAGEHCALNKLVAPAGAVLGELTARLLGAALAFGEAVSGHGRGIGSRRDRAIPQTGDMPAICLADS